MGKSKKSHLLPIIAILAVSLWSTWPVIANIKTAVTDSGDSILIVWILNQTIQKIPNDLGNIFQSNIFYPFKNVMAYSELLIPSAILSFLPVKVLGEPAAAFGFTLLLGQFATILVVYLWWTEITGNKAASLVAALALGLSQARMLYASHLQMWGMQWWLTASYFYYRFVKSGKVKYLYLSAAFFVIQAWESILPLFFILTAAIVTTITFGGIGKLLANRKKVIFLVILTFLFVSPVIGVYLGVSKQFNYVRPIREVAHFSASVDELWEKFLSPGLYFLTLASTFILWKKKKLRDKKTAFFITLFVIGMIMSLGPVLKFDGRTVKIFGNIFIPLPYGVLYYVLPVFKALRTPSRWFWLELLAMSGMSALSLSVVSKKAKKIVLPLAVILVIAGGATIIFPYQLPLKKDYPKVYQWLKGQDGDAVIELPMYTWASGEMITEELLRMIYSLEHGKRLANGYSGFFPPEWEKIVASSHKDFPDGKFGSLMKQIGVDYLIVHKRLLTEEKKERLESQNNGKRVWEDGETSVFKL